ncbi:MAG: type II toxin-antitoxin system VapC family toxin [Deltaproteobacteria bacterium]|nr:type II toxin-antitoxin system VapC family toxin [Deltaproteobacteria bacterium]
MASSVYVETTIVSYLTARPSRDLVQRAHQQLTRRWWRTRRTQFDLYVSPPVLQEAAGGDSRRAQKRLAALKAIPVLEATPEALRLATALVAAGTMPEQAAVDATHIAIATAHGMDYLLTWNCTHIANATMRSSIERICRNAGYEPPILCTPEELMED